MFQSREETSFLIQRCFSVGSEPEFERARGIRSERPHRRGRPACWNQSPAHVGAGQTNRSGQVSDVLDRQVEFNEVTRVDRRRVLLVGRKHLEQRPGYIGNHGAVVGA
jgi:hypothetical protein